MDLTQWLSLATVCLLGAMSPGPSLAVVLKATLGGGSTAGYASALAHGAGVALYGLLTVAGLAVLITSSPALFLVLQLAGAVYLVYLGVRSLRSTGESAPETPTSLGSAGAATSGFLVAFLNPKLAVFMLALFSQFVHPEAAWSEQAVLVSTVGGIDMSWYSLVVVLASSGNWIERLRRHKPRLDLGMGALLLLLAFSMAGRSLWELAS